MLDEYAGPTSLVERVPQGWWYDRRISRFGVNWEHTANDQYGRWVYRKM